ncbi:hypothetical protein BV898_10325 [Hypsibius exemplaris]|uniref:Uncharacterized protein n=1 Tax=Hypsibius exemplaris TaxID=2072580 RepID=A0A1W0WJQ3_HYPEX|nr:hypothetical protein BV898_10325 [Hypsibius exemplaris]
MSLQAPLKTFYLDDGTVGGTVKEVLDDLARVVDLGTKVGLSLNLSECEAFVYGGNAASRAAATATILQSAPDVRFPSSEGLELLGAPLMLWTVSAQPLTGRRLPSLSSPAGCLSWLLTRPFFSSKIAWLRRRCSISCGAHPPLPGSTRSWHSTP